MTEQLEAAPDAGLLDTISRSHAERAVEDITMPGAGGEDPIPFPPSKNNDFEAPPLEQYTRYG